MRRLRDGSWSVLAQLQGLLGGVVGGAVKVHGLLQPLKAPLTHGPSHEHDVPYPGTVIDQHGPVTRMRGLGRAAPAALERRHVAPMAQRRVAPIGLPAETNSDSTASIGLPNPQSLSLSVR